MLAEALLAFAIATPAADQWDSLFNKGYRWPTCAITYESTEKADTKYLRLAVRDIQRKTGISLVKVPSGGQVKIAQYDTPSPSGITYIAQAASWTKPDSTEYAGGVVWGWKWLTMRNGRSQRSTWQHELGHVLGLGHNPKPREVMAPYAHPKAPLGTPGYVGALRALYPECK